MEKIVLEYSLQQKAFHRSNIEDMLTNNMANIYHNRTPGYVPIAILNTDKECDEFMEAFKNIISNKQ